VFRIEVAVGDVVLNHKILAHGADWWYLARNIISIILLTNLLLLFFMRRKELAAVCRILITQWSKRFVKHRKDLRIHIIWKENRFSLAHMKIHLEQLSISRPIRMTRVSFSRRNYELYFSIIICVYLRGFWLRPFRRVRFVNKWERLDVDTGGAIRPKPEHPPPIGCALWLGPRTLTVD
jgi:hypothetical protein